MYICEACREEVRPKSEPGILFAVELKNVSAFNPGGTREFAEGRGVFFHEYCYPTGSPHFRQKPMPAGIDDGDERS
jgi:hypothetical protein